MATDPIHLDQIVRILMEARQRLGGQSANPPGWQDKPNYRDAPGGTVTMPGNTRPQGDPGAETPVDPGMPGPHVPGDPPGWSPRAYAYGDMASHHVLTDDQAQAFQLMMNILGHNGDTVGRGSTRNLL